MALMSEGDLLHRDFALCICNIAIGRRAPNAPVELDRMVALMMGSTSR